jgi:putative oxidoreductase
MSQVPVAAQSISPPASVFARTFPFVRLSLALHLLRIGTAILFMLHAVVRVLTPGSIAQFGRAMTHFGFPNGVGVVWALTVFEVGGGLLMILGVKTRVMASGFAVILLTGIVLIHRRLGWFVGEHGTGGSEYSVALLLALLVIAAADGDGRVRD